MVIAALADCPKLEATIARPTVTKADKIANSFFITYY